MSVTAPKGFVAGATNAGIRKQDRLDLTLVHSTVPATGAGMFTVNRMQAAPVTVCKEHLELAQPQAIVANSGVANAATGEQGLADARATAAAAAAKLGIAPEQVLVLSTGVIGAPLPLDKVLAFPGVVQADTYLQVGETIRPVRVDGDRRGYVIAIADTNLDALDRAEAAARLVDVEVEAG